MPPERLDGTGRPPCAPNRIARFHGAVTILTRQRLRAATAAGVLAAALAGGVLAHADGQLDPTFNGGVPRVGTNAEGLAWSTQSVRVPAIVQADGRIVVAGQRAGAATLARFNADGSLDTSYGTGGFVSARFAGTPTSQPGTSAATALALDPSDDVLATGFGASQSMFVARFSPAGTMTASVVCFAPHLIDYTAYAIAERPDGSVVIAGQARDRWHGTPYKFYGARAVVQVTGGSARSNGCGTWSASAATGKPLGSSGVAIDGLAHDGTLLNGGLAGRIYHGVAVRTDGSFVTAAVNGTVSSFTAGGAVDSAFGTGGTTAIPASALHAVRLLADGSVLAAGESTGAASARRLLVARLSPGGNPSPGFGTAGVVRVLGGTGNNQGQALALQADGRILIAGGAVTTGNVSALAVARLTPAGLPDTTWSPSGVVTTPLGATGYATGIVPSAGGLVVSGRRADSALGNAYLDLVLTRYVGGP
jgi:uncharacterized delta-60 repeat protein